MTREEIIALAKQHGASAYTNRHYQDETYMTFSPEKLEAFFYAAQKLVPESEAQDAKRMQVLYESNDITPFLREYHSGVTLSLDAIDAAMLEAAKESQG